MVPSAFKSDLKSKLPVSDALGDVNNIPTGPFSTVSMTVLDLHATQCTKTHIIRPQLYNKDIKLQIDKDDYNIQHGTVVKLIEQSKEEYLKSILQDCSCKTTFKTLGMLLNNNSRILPTFDTLDKLCNKFAKFFTEKVNKISSL